MFLKCSKCEVEHARVEQNLDGSLKLIVNPPSLALVVQKRPGKEAKAFLKCPQCGNEDPVDLDFLKKF